MTVMELSASKLFNGNRHFCFIQTKLFLVFPESRKDIASEIQTIVNYLFKFGPTKPNTVFKRSGVTNGCKKKI